MENRPISEIYRSASEDWVDKEQAAQLLEDTKSLALAQRCSALGDIPVNRAEQTIKASQEWEDYVRGIVEARAVANKAKMNLEVIKMQFAEWNNHEANARQEMKMVS